MILWVVVGYVVILICLSSIGARIEITGQTDGTKSLRHFLLEIIPFSIIEEAVFRGMLYMFLVDLGVSQNKTFWIQAFVFWISHINYIISSPVNFWLTIPILSLLLGYLAHRSRSLTPSAIAHILYNSIAAFVVF
jgi:membrane protease YdiL (CAAX protease family)